MRRHSSVSFKRARLVLVAADDCGLTDTIRRLGVASVSCASDLESARTLCAAADACIVVLPRAVPDEPLHWSVETEAPGRDRIPGLLIAEVVTPHVRRAARKAGYNRVISRGLPHRMLYRCIGALLQAHQTGEGRLRRRGNADSLSGLLGSELAGAGKLKLQ